MKHIYHFVTTYANVVCVNVAGGEGVKNKNVVNKNSARRCSNGKADFVCSVCRMPAVFVNVMPSYELSCV